MEDTKTAKLTITIDGKIFGESTTTNMFYLKWSDIESHENVNNIIEKVTKISKKYDSVEMVTMELLDNDYKGTIITGIRFVNSWNEYRKMIWDTEQRRYKEIKLFEGEKAKRLYNKELKNSIKYMHDKLEKQHIKKMHELIKVS